MEAASVNFGVEAGINRMKNFIKRYRPSGIGFPEGDDPRRHSIIDFWEVLMLVDSEAAARVSGAAETVDYFG